MKTVIPLIYASVLLIVFPILLSCDGSSVADIRMHVDSLNTIAYSSRYRSLDSTETKAKQALSMACGYADGRDEALCNLAFVRLMRMDYAGARRLFSDVLEESENELMMLVADVGMMKICQRISANKDFYDYHNSAIKRMERIRREEAYMNPHQKRLWCYARSEFHFVSSVYYYYLRQDRLAAEEIDCITENFQIVEDDSAQLAYYYYMIGSGGILDGMDGDDVVGEEEERMLVRALALGRQSGMILFEGMALQGLADCFIRADTLNRGRMMFIRGMLDADTVRLHDMPLFMAERSLELCGRYGSMLYMSAAYITISEWYLSKQCYDLSFASVVKALECVNAHHRKYCRNHGEGVADGGEEDSVWMADDTLYPYREYGDSVSTEMNWIADADIVAVPEWMASIREHLSKVYSAMGMKRESDYNRNIYLDILDVTRQDMRMQQRFETLELEEKKINALLVLVGVLIVILVSVMAGLGKRLKRRSECQAEKLSGVIELCRKLTAQVAADAADSGSIVSALHAAVDNDMETLFPCAGRNWEVDDCGLKGYDLELLNIVRVFFRWAVKNGETFVLLGDEGRNIEEEHCMYEMNIANNKRANIDKRTCLSIVYGIAPFLDRVVNEVGKLIGCADRGVVKERLLYISELISKINEYNDVLTHWVKVKQGAVSLNVETFCLGTLFDTLNKMRGAFDNKHISLEIKPSSAIVKADKPLTLFMMNTLLDNARKYTPEGGSVCLEAEEMAEYVEISVKDTGRGLSAEDVALICGEKVYDSARIGDVDNDAELRSCKGYGFGLMNCKGIIEKYRKTSKVFAVCTFGIDSKLGHGSRFFFRLPKGVVHVLCLMSTLSACLGMFSCRDAVSGSGSGEEYEWTSDDSLLRKASVYADSAYYANVEGAYRNALLYADSARMSLNAYYRKMVPEGEELMTMDGGSYMPEIELWNRGFDTDYHVILDIRNEVAIAALALNDWHLYVYNNEIYTRLYKLMAQDKRLEDYCNAIQQTNINKQTVLILVVLLVVCGLLVYYLIYYRHNVLPVFNMRQLMQFNGRLFAAKKGDEAEVLLHGISDIRMADGVGLCIVDDAGQKLRCDFSRSCPDKDIVEEIMNLCIRESAPVVKAGGRLRAYPLTMEDEEGAVTLGAMAMVLHDSSLSEDEELVFLLVAQFTAIHFYYSSIKVSTRMLDIELLEDERNRAELEANNLHVQNMVLDNCLSTIKHETMYYPNKIKQIADSMNREESGGEMFTDRLYGMSELVNYYKETFTLLSSCALRQLGKVVFRRKTVDVAALAEYMERSVAKLNRKHHMQLELCVDCMDGLSVTGDVLMLEYMIDNLLSFSFEHEGEGRLSFVCRHAGGFVVFAYSDSRLPYDAAEPQRIFYADNIRYDADSDRLQGAQYLVCKQIIREHDEYVGHRGCRIYAEQHAGDGCLSVVFTVPERKRTLA